MRKKMVLLLVGLMLSGVASTASAIDVRGGSSCGQWVSDKGVSEHGHKKWFLGYMSGIALGYKQDVLKGKDSASLFLWMDNYCRANPLKRVDEGGDELFIELIKQKGIE